jgi:formylglycine-generating enzyme
MRIGHLSAALLMMFVGAATAAPMDKWCADYSGVPEGGGETAGMVFVPGGAFAMGSDRQLPEESSTHIVRVDGFHIDRHEVTNAQFKRFVAATGYVTLAERGPDKSVHKDLPADVQEPGSVVFVQPVKGGDVTRWWQYVKGANWRQPEGPDSSIAGRENQPVVHIAYDDALAYARWLGRDLPTEAQWEYAARGGREDGTVENGAFDAEGKPAANTWQGIFPVYNTADDGYAGAAPVACFKPNGFGLYDMIGNVWEWTSDWYAAGHSRYPEANPMGPNLVHVRLAPGATPTKVIKGGSYLCSGNFCGRYRASARQPQEIDLGTSHIGFRTVLNKSLATNAAALAPR